MGWRIPSKSIPSEEVSSAEYLISGLFQFEPSADDGGENPTVKQVRRRAKWDNDDYVCRGLILNDTVIKHNFFLPPLDQTSNLLTYKFAMTTLTNKAILSGADNRPPMLEKDMHDSWKSRMELYMMNIQHGRMILESVENGPLIWPSIKENRVTQPKKYSELYATEAIQADCDVKATNIILQRLPPEVYALVSNHKVAKELWERIQLLMQGTSLMKQEMECKLLMNSISLLIRRGNHYVSST
uniref:Integrase, catalytic region, zinc finger, CCHC-type, peptidase aspartic, catalytic n=1 Tax=Tanacetum cinerariifolium TaxID=118510 RepID=A0A6L2MNF5_TANCI|nr:hypothetical protein [Tanacetum cinerariifolium]